MLCEVDLTSKGGECLVKTASPMVGAGTKAASVVDMVLLL